MRKHLTENVGSEGEDRAISLTEPFYRDRSIFDHNRDATINVTHEFIPVAQGEDRTERASDGMKLVIGKPIQPDAWVGNGRQRVKERADAGVGN
jgi:hypothetical protein